MIDIRVIRPKNAILKDRVNMGAGDYMAEEIASQPDLWPLAAEVGANSSVLPARGDRVAVVGCGTSWFMAQSYAALRESAGLGVTDAFAASEAFLERDYDGVVVISRSGTTTEVIDVLDRLDGRTRTVAVVGDEDTPVARRAGHVVAMPFADERSVVQTRWATSALVMLRASLGVDVAGAVEEARLVLAMPLESVWLDAGQFSFLGRGWTCGLAHEAALKMREAARSWAESYPAMEYRHGPIAIAEAGRVVWMFGPAPAGLAAEVDRTGASFVGSSRDPVADLVLVQRLALERALAGGLDPDRPRHLTRSVVLAP